MSIFYGTFKSCPKFFEQLYTARVQRWNLQPVCLCASTRQKETNLHTDTSTSPKFLQRKKLYIESCHCSYWPRSDNDQCCTLHLARSSRGTQQLPSVPGLVQKDSSTQSHQRLSWRQIPRRTLASPSFCTTNSLRWFRSGMFSHNSHWLDARHNRSKFVCRLHIWHVPTSRLLLHSDHVGRHLVPKRQNHKCLWSIPQTFSIQPPDLSPKYFHIHGSSQGGTK